VGTVRDLVLNHFYLFPRDYAIKQWAGSGADHSKQDIAAGDRLAKERHEKLKKMGYLGWGYDPQAVQDYQEAERVHKGSSGL
jgi:hypothetical protein